MTATETTPVRGTVEHLLERWRDHGDARALAALFDRTAPELFRIALAVSSDAAGADEAVQETFLAILEDPRACDTSRPVMPWLATVLRNKLIDGRRRQRRVVDPLKLEPRILPEDPADAASRRDAVDRVRKAIDRLAEPYRAVAMLRWEYGLEPGEIAHARGEPPGTTRSLLSRALEKLRGDLGGMAALALVLGVRPPRGLAAIRSNLLAHAGVTAAGGLTVAGIAVTGTSAAIVVVAAFVAGGVTGALAVPARSVGERAEATEAVIPTTAPIVARAATRARSGAAARDESSSTTKRAGRDPSAAAAPVEDVRRRVDRLLDELDGSWATAWRAGKLISRLEPAREAVDAVRTRWPALSRVIDRQNLLKGFSADATCPLRLEVFDLGIDDADSRVQEFALSYFAPYAGRTVEEDLEGCRAWRRATRGQSPESLLDASAAKLLAEFPVASPAARPDLLRLLANVVGKRRSDALTQTVLSVASGWLGDVTISNPERVLDLVLSCRPDAAWVATTFDALVSRGGEAQCRAFALARRLRHAPAFDALVTGLASADEDVAAAAAQTLGELGDRRALPALVASLRTRSAGAATKAVIDALENLTLIDSSRGRDAAWWLAWWQTNGTRYEDFLRKETGR